MGARLQRVQSNEGGVVKQSGDKIDHFRRYSRAKYLKGAKGALIQVKGQCLLPNTHSFPWIGANFWKLKFGVVSVHAPNLFF